MATTVRPTKKQQQLLEFIEKFVAMHGYGPSYREICAGLGYKSVATVATHIDNLIARGHLVKKTRSARSLEVVNKATEVKPLPTDTVKPAEEKWLVDKIDYYFHRLEEAQSVTETDVDGLYVLVGSLKVLGLEGAAQSFIPRLSALKSRVAKL